MILSCGLVARSGSRGGLGTRAAGLITVGMLLVSLLAGVARSASESSPGIPTSARFVTLFQKTPDGCVGSFAIEFKKVRGATFYTFRYQMRGYGLQTNANVNTDAEMVGYKGPRPPAGSGITVPGTFLPSTFSETWLPGPRRSTSIS